MAIVDSQPDQQLWATLNNGGAGFVRVDRDGSDTGTNQDRVNEFTAPIIRPNDIVFDTVHGLYFFADSVNGNRRIIQGNIADLLDPTATPTFKVLYTDTSPGTAGGQILGLAIDVDAATGEGHLYFVNQNGLKRVSYEHDGNSALNQTPTVLAQLPAGSFANEIALDIENNRAFILSTASATSPVEVPEGTPGAIFDEDSGVWFIFATNVTNNEIWQVSGLDRTDASTADTSVSRLLFPGGDNGGQDLPDAEGLLQSIDIDPTTGMLYFTTQQINSGAFGETGGVFRYDLAGGTYETLYVEGNATDYSLEYIDVDPVTGRYYVSNLSFDDVTGANTSSILVHELTAGTPTQFASLSYPAGAVPQGLIVLNAPTLAGEDAGAVTTEDAGSGSGASSAAVAISSPDANDGDTAGLIDQLAGAQVRVASGFGTSPGASELLTINGTTVGVLDYGSQDISYSYNAATGVMTLSGASSFANYESALALVSYSISGDNPDAYGASTSRVLGFSVFDGLLHSDENQVTVTIAATNDAPVNTVGAPVTTLEGSPAAISGLSVSDVDADPANDTISVTLSAGLGNITVSTSEAGGVGAAQVSGNGTGTVVITGTQNEINATFAAANGVTYTGTDGGADLLTMTTSDLGNGGAGGAQQDVDAVVVTVIPLNDPPTAPASNSVSTAEDTESAAVSIGADDPDDDTLTYSEKLGAGAAHGTVTFDQANGTFTYTPDADYNGTDSFTILISDGQGGFAEQDVSVTVTPVNDAPTGVSGDLSAPEDANNGTAAGTLVGQDPDSGSFTYTLLDDAGGRYAMDSNGNVTVADGLLLDYEQASSHTIRVRVTDDQGASSEFDVSVAVSDILGEDVTGDARANTFWGGAEADTLRGMGGDDVLKGGGGQDTLLGGIGLDTLYGGTGADTMTGGDGNDTFVLRKGEANGDVITDFFGRGNADGDSIVLEGYGAGTTFTRVGGGSSNIYAINDNGQIEYVTIYATGQVHGSDYEIVTAYDYAFAG
jgi:hypothetical protein